MRRLCAAEWFLSHPASAVMTLSSLSTGGGALFLVKTSTPLHRDAECSRNLLFLLLAVSTQLPHPPPRTASEHKSPPLPSLPPSLHEPANLHCCSAVKRHSALAVFLPPSSSSSSSAELLRPTTHPPESVGISDDRQTPKVWKTFAIMNAGKVNLDTYNLSLLTAKEDILNPRSSTNW